MILNKKRFYIATVLFLLLIAGIYVGLKERPGVSSDVSISSEALTDSNVSDLMASMNILHFTELQKAPDFELTSLDGEQLSLSQYRGNVVLLSFWATW